VHLTVNVPVQLAVIPAQIGPFPPADAAIIRLVTDRLPAELSLLSVEPGGLRPCQLAAGNAVVYALIFIPQGMPVLCTCVGCANASDDYCNYDQYLFHAEVLKW
jgi:hypothetical protein